MRLTRKPFRQVLAAAVLAVPALALSGGAPQAQAQFSPPTDPTLAALLQLGNCLAGQDWQSTATAFGPEFREAVEGQVEATVAVLQDGDASNDKEAITALMETIVKAAEENPGLSQVLDGECLALVRDVIASV